MPQFLPYQNASFVSTELRTLVTNGEAKRIWVLSLDVLNVDWQPGYSEPIWRGRAVEGQRRTAILSSCLWRKQEASGLRAPEDLEVIWPLFYQAHPVSSSCTHMSKVGTQRTNLKHGCHGCHGCRGCRGQIGSVAPPRIVDSLAVEHAKSKEFLPPVVAGCWATSMVWDGMGWYGYERVRVNLETQFDHA